MFSFHRAIWGILGLMFFLTASAQAAEHDPAILNAVEVRVQQLAGTGEIPIVIFDLDDTVIDTRERNLRILRDFASQPEIMAQYPEAIARLSGLAREEVRYILADTLRARGIDNEEFIRAAGAFWIARFFTNEYCVDDVPNPGAVEYTRELAWLGAKIVYLTGRDTPRMGIGTHANLAALGFPLEQEGAKLMMKPDPAMDDLEFKRQALAEIAELGVVAAAFENEPANINLLHGAFPGAIAVFLDTVHSPRPDVPQPGITWVGNFVVEQDVSRKLVRSYLLRPASLAVDAGWR